MKNLNLICLFFVILTSCTKTTTKEAKVNGSTGKMNVLFIISDDLRTELGAYGYPHMHTPNIDRLASEGRLFRQAHVQQSICNPSRMSFLTGLRPDEIQVHSNRDHFRARVPEATTIPQHFRENGYRTQSIGKIFHGGMDDPFAWSVPKVKFSRPKYGPEVQAEADSARAVLEKEGKLQRRWLQLDSATGLPIRQIREKGVEFHSISWEAPDVDPFYFADGKNCKYAMQTLDTLAQTGEPFFLAVGFSRPHTPYVAPARFFELYPIDTLENESRQAPADAPEWAFPGHKELEGYRDITEGGIPDEKQRTLRRAYRASVSYIDFLVGALIDHLREINLYDNTVIVLIGDHGYHLGEQNIWTKQTNFDWGTRAPLIVKAPDQKDPGKPTNALVEFIDLLPTLAELADLPVPAPASGKSFASVIESAELSHKDYVFSQYPRKRQGKRAMGYSVRSAEWRYTRWKDRDTGEILAEELYDMSNNTFEKENLASQPAYLSELDKWRGILDLQDNI